MRQALNTTLQPEAAPLQEEKPRHLEWPTTHTTLSVVLPFLPDSVTQRNTDENSKQRSSVGDPLTGRGQGLGKITVHSENLRRQIASARTQKEMEGKFVEKTDKGRHEPPSVPKAKGRSVRGEKGAGREEDRRNGILKMGNAPTVRVSPKKEVSIVEETKISANAKEVLEPPGDEQLRSRRRRRLLNNRIGQHSPRRSNKEISESPPPLSEPVPSSHLYPNTNTSKPNTPLRSYYDRPDDGIPYSHKASLQTRHRREDELRHAAASRRRRLPAMREGAFPERQIITHLDESTQAKLQEAAKRDGEIEGAMNAPGGAVCVVGYESMEEKGFRVQDPALPVPTSDSRRPPPWPQSLQFRTPISPSDLDLNRREGRFGDKNTEKIISAHSVLATAVAAAAFSDANLLLRPPDDLSLQYRLCELDIEERNLKEQFQQILSHYQRKDERGRKLRSNRNRKEYCRLQEWIKQHGSEHAIPMATERASERDSVRYPPIQANDRRKKIVGQLEEPPIQAKKWIQPSKHVTLNNHTTQETRQNTVPLVG